MDMEIKEENITERPKKKYSGLILMIVLIFLWLIVRPGIFTIQPIGALPEGITLIYHSRNSEMDFFSSPDGLCLDLQGSVTLICRLSALSSVEELTDRILFRLPYIHWIYLISTDGIEFDR